MTLLFQPEKRTARKNLEPLQNVFAFSAGSVQFLNIMDCKSLWFHLAREIWSFFAAPTFSEGCCLRQRRNWELQRIFSLKHRHFKLYTSLDLPLHFVASFQSKIACIKVLQKKPQAYFFLYLEPSGICDEKEVKSNIGQCMNIIL